MIRIRKIIFLGAIAFIIGLAIKGKSLEAFALITALTIGFIQPEE